MVELRLIEKKKKNVYKKNNNIVFRFVWRHSVIRNGHEHFRSHSIRITYPCVPINTHRVRGTLYAVVRS